MKSAGKKKASRGCYIHPRLQSKIKRNEKKKKQRKEERTRDRKTGDAGGVRKKKKKARKKMSSRYIGTLVDKSTSNQNLYTGE